MGAIFSICGLGQLACCAGSSLCGLFSCCSAFNSSRIMYSVMLFLVTITGWIMVVPNVSNWLKSYVPFCWHTPIPKTMTESLSEKVSSVFGANSSLNDFFPVAAPANVTDPTGCEKFTGYLAVYRLMFATTIFFVVFSVIMIRVKSSRDPRVQLHEGLWGIKFLLLIGGIVGAFFIPASDGFTETWKIFGLTGAFLFLLIQFYFIILFADNWAEDWVGRMEEEDSNTYYYSLIICSMLNFCFVITGVVLFYVFYSGANCGLHKFFISVNFILCVLLSVLTILPKVQEFQPRSGLLQASVVSLYLTYLTWSALNNSPYTECKPVLWSAGKDDTSLSRESFISLVICFGCVLYSSMRLSSRSQFEKITGVSNLSTDDASHGEEDNENRSNWSYFYFILALGTLYLMMTLTNWYSPTESYGNHFGESTSSLWIKMSSSWICASLYLWTLIAPILLGDCRDFS